MSIIGLFSDFGWSWLALCLSISSLAMSMAGRTHTKSLWNYKNIQNDRFSLSLNKNCLVKEADTVKFLINQRQPCFVVINQHDPSYPTIKPKQDINLRPTIRLPCLLRSKDACFNDTSAHHQLAPQMTLADYLTKVAGQLAHVFASKCGDPQIPW